MRRRGERRHAARGPYARSPLIPFFTVMNTTTNFLLRCRLAVAAILASALLAGAGCNTMGGAGKDLEKAAEGIQDAAK